MYRTPHNDHGGMKVWLAADEVKQFLALVDDTTHRIALLLSLRSAEIITVTPADLPIGPAGTMLRVPEGKGGKYRETPVPAELEMTIRTVRRPPERLTKKRVKRRYTERGGRRPYRRALRAPDCP